MLPYLPPFIAAAIAAADDAAVVAVAVAAAAAAAESKSLFRAPRNGPILRNGTIVGAATF